MKNITEVLDFRLGEGENEMIEQLLKEVRQWKEGLCMVDELACRLFEAAELRCLEVLSRGYGTLEAD